MVTYRFRSRIPAVPTIMTEKGHRRTDPERGKLPSAESSAPQQTLLAPEKEEDEAGGSPRLIEVRIVDPKR